jgi:hypothetical protein
MVAGDHYPLLPADSAKISGARVNCRMPIIKPKAMHPPLTIGLTRRR